MKQDRATKSPPGQLSLRLSSVFVGLNIINLLKDSMKLEQTQYCGPLINSLKGNSSSPLSGVSDSLAFVRLPVKSHPGV